MKKKKDFKPKNKTDKVNFWNGFFFKFATKFIIGVGIVVIVLSLYK